MSELNRDEIALRFAVADYGVKCAAYYAGTSSDTILNTAEDAYKMADAMLKASRPACDFDTLPPLLADDQPAPVAPAIDREGLARVLHAVWNASMFGTFVDPWDSLSDSVKRGYLAEADAMIARGAR